MQCSSRVERVLLADNNAHPNPASSLQNEVLGIGLNGKGWGWLVWAGFGVEQFSIAKNILTNFSKLGVMQNLFSDKHLQVYKISGIDDQFLITQNILTNFSKHGVRQNSIS